MIGTLLPVGHVIPFSSAETGRKVTLQCSPLPSPTLAVKGSCAWCLSRAWAPPPSPAAQPSAWVCRLMTRCVVPEVPSSPWKLGELRICSPSPALQFRDRRPPRPPGPAKPPPEARATGEDFACGGHARSGGRSKHVAQCRGRAWLRMAASGRRASWGRPTAASAPMQHEVLASAVWPRNQEPQGPVRARAGGGPG